MAKIISFRYYYLYEKEMKDKKHLENKYVIQKNELIYGDTSVFSLEDLKVFKLVISKVNSQNLLFNDEYEISYDELKALNINETHLYQNVLTSLKKLANIYIKLDSNPTNSKKGTTKEVGLIQNNFKYKKYSKRFYVSFHDDMKDYLLQIKDKFTKYPIVEIADLKQKYSLKLYEYLRSTNLTNFEITLDKLKSRLDISIDSYKQFGGFKLKVLEPAVSQINETTSLVVTYEPVKDGKKIVKVRFIIKKEKETQNTTPLPFVKKAPKLEKVHPVMKLINKKILIQDEYYTIKEIDDKEFFVTVKNEDNEEMEMRCSSLDEIHEQLKGFIVD